jgi:hypothetical protein
MEPVLVFRFAVVFCPVLVHPDKRTPATALAAAKIAAKLLSLILKYDIASSLIEMT